MSINDISSKQPGDVELDDAFRTAKARTDAMRNDERLVALREFHKFLSDDPGWQKTAALIAWAANEIDYLRSMLSRETAQCEAAISLAEHQQVRTERFHDALYRIAHERYRFLGPSLDYMQGYRDGQGHFSKIARTALEE